MSKLSKLITLPLRLSDCDMEIRVAKKLIMDRRGRRAKPKCSLKKKPFKRAKLRKNDITPGLKAYKKVNTLGKGSKKQNGKLGLNFPLSVGHNFHPFFTPLFFFCN